MRKQGIVVSAMMLTVAFAPAKWYQVGSNSREAVVDVVEQGNMGTLPVFLVDRAVCGC